MATAARPVYLIKYDASGMPLHHGWHGSQWVGGEPQPGRRTFYPGERADDPNQACSTSQCWRNSRRASNTWSKAAAQPIVRGFLWMQGEQDAKHLVSATAYAASLRRLRQRLAADTGTAADLPLAFGQVLPHEPALDRFTNRTEMRAQMAAADMDSGKPEAMPRTRMVSTDGFGLAADTVHYNAEGQLRLGRAFARAMKVMAADRIAGSEHRKSPANVPRSAIAERLVWQGIAIEETELHHLGRVADPGGRQSSTSSPRAGRRRT